MKRPGTEVTVVAVAGAVPHALAGGGAPSESVSWRWSTRERSFPLDREAILGFGGEDRASGGGRSRPRDGLRGVGGLCPGGRGGFWHLQAPIARVTTPHCHIPFSPPPGGTGCLSQRRAHQRSRPSTLLAEVLATWDLFQSARHLPHMPGHNRSRSASKNSCSMYRC